MMRNMGGQITILLHYLSPFKESKIAEQVTIPANATQRKSDSWSSAVCACSQY